MTVTHADICILGAGPVGGTLAVRLAAAGRTVAVIDRAALPPMEHPDFDGRAYAVAAGSRALLKAAGLWDALPLPPGPIRAIRISDGRVGRPAGRLHLHFAAAEIGAEAFGWMVEARSLRMAINARLHATPGLTVHAPAEVTVTRTAAGATVTLPDGAHIICRLVIGAEGRASASRTAAGIPTTRLVYDQLGIVAAIAHERPHHGTALEHFLPGGPFAQLPLAAGEAGENLSAIVWTERLPLADRILGLDSAAFTRELSRRLGDHLGEVRLVGRRWHYPLSAMLAHRWTDTRLALVGDAAHGIHPIAGQGLNLGFRDAMALADLVLAGTDPGAADLLRRYQSRRRADTLAMLAATDALDRLFSTDLLPVRVARDFGLAAVGRLPALKRAFMRTATGL